MSNLQPKRISPIDAIIDKSPSSHEEDPSVFYDQVRSRFANTKISSPQMKPIPFESVNSLPPFQAFQNNGSFQTTSNPVPFQVSTSPISTPSPTSPASPVMRNTLDIFFEPVFNILREIENKVNKEAPSRNLIDYKIFKSSILNLKEHINSTHMNLQKILNDKDFQIEELRNFILQNDQSDKFKITSIINNKENNNNNINLNNNSNSNNLNNEQNQRSSPSSLQSLLDDGESDLTSSDDNYFEYEEITSIKKKSNVKLNSSQSSIKPPKEEWATEALLGLTQSSTTTTTSNNTDLQQQQQENEKLLRQNREHRHQLYNSSKNNNNNINNNNNNSNNNNKSNKKPVKYNFVSSFSMNENNNNNINNNNINNDQSDLSHSSSDGEYKVSRTMAPIVKRKRGKLPGEATSILKQWLFEHNMHPYPTEEEKAYLARVTSLSFSQINNWFTNARRRILPKQMPPRVYGSPLYSHFSQNQIQSQQHQQQQQQKP